MPCKPGGRGGSGSVCSCLSPQPIAACGGKVEISCEQHREVKESARYCGGSAQHGWRLVGVEEGLLGGLFLFPSWQHETKLGSDKTCSGANRRGRRTRVQQHRVAGGQVELLGSSSTSKASLKGPAPATSVFLEPCMTDNALVGSSLQHGDSFRGSDGRDRPRLPLG